VKEGGRFAVVRTEEKMADALAAIYLEDPSCANYGVPVVCNSDRRGLPLPSAR